MTSLSNIDHAILQPMYNDSKMLFSLVSLVMSWACLGLSMGVQQGFREYFFCIEWVGENNFWEEVVISNACQVILNGACLFLWKKNEWVEVNPASFFFPATPPPAAFLDRCFVNLSLLRVSDFLSPIYIRNDLLTLSFPLQQVQWQPLDFLFSHDRCQTEALRKKSLLKQSHSMRSDFFIH